MSCAAASRPPIVTIVGPTAAGKTTLAIDLCERLGGEIVGADSVQVYRHCDIGSGKPTREELRGIAHHLIDIVDPNTAIDAAQFAQLADRAIEDVASRGHLPIVVGGTGLWLRALLLGLAELPAVDAQLRAQLEEHFLREGASAMHRKLAEVDPISAATIHPNDQLRVVRALEVHAQTGTPLGEIRRAHALGGPRYPILGLYVDLPLALYRAVVVQRVRTMLAAGFEREVRDLLDRYGADIRALGAVGYRQMRDYVLQARSDSDLSSEVCVEADIVRATEQYARRQRNWFRSDQTINLRLDPAEARNAITLNAIQRHLDRHAARA